MGLLDDGEVTREEIMHNVRQKIRKKTNRLLNKTAKQHRELFSYVWENPEGVTAQEIFDEYGTDAVQLFVLSSGIQNLIESIDPNSPSLSTPFPYTINPDGTVTVHYS